jgi:hypothetical protein
MHFIASEARFLEVAGVNFELSTARVMLARTLANLGQLVELESRVNEPLRDAIRRNDLYSVIGMRTLAGFLLALARDDVRKAEEEVIEATRVLATRQFHIQHVYCFTAAAAIDLYRGDAARALIRLDAHRPALATSLLDRMSPVRILLDHLYGRAHVALAARGAPSRADHLRRANRAATRLQREGLAFTQAFAALLRAAVATIRGDSEHANGELRAAIRGFDQCEMGLHAATARHVLGRRIDGDAGRDLTRAAMTWFERERVAAPEGMVRLWAPGFS